MNFREYELPVDANYASVDEVPEATRQILEVYEAINNRSTIYRPERVNALLDEFVGQECYIVEDEEESDEDYLELLGVANYRKERKKGFGWVDGLAVHPEQRSIGVGRFVLDNLVEITRDSGLSEIRLKSVPSAVSFYQRNGFVVMEESLNDPHPYMSREIK
jgi:ribosomal protein S18 acetylase RimI-like enzyme